MEKDLLKANNKPYKYIIHQILNITQFTEILYLNRYYKYINITNNWLLKNKYLISELIQVI